MDCRIRFSSTEAFLQARLRQAVLWLHYQIIEHSLFSNQSAALWIYGVIFGLYFVICYPLSLISRYLETRWES